MYKKKQKVLQVYLNWKTPPGNRYHITLILFLNRLFTDASMWNYNITYVDVFVKGPKLAGARKLLSKARIPFEVIIDDVQKAIDNENPPKDAVDLWENRDGK